MKIADTFSDGQKRTWTVGECLGRGLWGRAYLVRDADGHERVLKVALTSADFLSTRAAPRDFPADTPVPADVPKLCASALDEQARLLERGDLPYLPRLEGRITLPDGRVGLLLPRFQANLARKLESGMALTSAIELVRRVTALLARSGQVHGNLRPSNVMLGERGAPVLVDVMTPAAARLAERLASTGRARWRPPEAASPEAVWDTWALCQALWQAAMLRDTTPGASHRLEAPVEGLDKVALATLKDRILARLGAEGTNPRFRSRIADRLAAALNRGLSRPAEPSPPYRFLDAPALLARVEEVTALLAPRVGEVGRVLLANAADTSGTFQGGQAVSFAVSVGCTPGVADHDDVACGLQLVDLDAPEANARVPVGEARFRVTTHPSGRMRFQFDLPRVPPGRYRVRVAFSVKDSGQEPQVAEGRFEVRPPPGYVPPPIVQEEVRGTMIALDRARPGRDADERPTAIAKPLPTSADEDEETVAVEPRATDLARASGPARTPVRASDPARTSARPRAEAPADEPSDWASDAGSDPGAEIIEGWFPRPIAPPADDVDNVDDEPVAAPSLLPALVELEETEASFAASAGGAVSASDRPVALAPGANTVPVMPRPSIAAPRPAIGAPVAARPVIALPQPSGSAGRASGAPAIAIAAASSLPEAEDWSEDPIDWAALPGDVTDHGIEHEALPHLEGEDLPSWRRGELPFDTRSIPGLPWLVERIQRDATTALVAAVAGCFFLLLGCMALLKSC